jgi:stalled ribosome rescue protein Dom34
MNKQLGVWIDHKKAVIAIQSEQGETIQRIESGAGKHVQHHGATHPKSPYSAQYQQGDDQLDNKFNEKLNKFYGKVIDLIRTSDSVLILGPGEAKVELEKRLVHEKVKVQIIGIETVDKMTDRQIAAKVRSRFQESGIGA